MQAVPELHGADPGWELPLPEVRARRHEPSAVSSWQVFALVLFVGWGVILLTNRD